MDKSDYKLKNIINKNIRLQEERSRIINMQSEDSLNAILSSSSPVSLVQSFPEEDLFFLVHDIGVHDALQVLSLASSRQWEYILDMDIWDRDRLDFVQLTKWMDVLLKADGTRLVHWLLAEKLEFLEHYLFRNIEVRIREHDESPSDFGDGFYTTDDIFYIRHLENIYEEPSDEEYKEIKEGVVSRLVQEISSIDHTLFQQILTEFAGVIPSEIEEEDYRLRNVRLAEKGFMPFSDALEIFSPVSPEDLPSLGEKVVVTDPVENALMEVPDYSFGMMDEANHFTRALDVVDNQEILRNLQVEFASLCNMLISAEQKTIREKEELSTIVKKACSYVSIGLEHTSGEKEEISDSQNSLLISRYPLTNLFRIGYGLAVELKGRAEKWHKESWFKGKKLPLGFWGEDWLGVLGGLLLKRPLYFDNYETGVLYREFETLNDIEVSSQRLNDLIGFDELMSLVSADVSPIPGFFITYKNFLLTLWARNRLDLSNDFSPIPPDKFRMFFSELWEAGESGSKTIKLSMKSEFLNWLISQTSLTDLEISQRLGDALEKLFNEIENEFAPVEAETLDPRYVHLFCIEHEIEEDFLDDIEEDI